MFVFQLGVACLLVGALGAREAFRYRLLTSSAAKPTTALSAVALLAWIGVIIWSTITIDILHATAILAISFVFGNLIRFLLTSISGQGHLSPESSAQYKYEHMVASERAAAAKKSPEFRSVVRRFNLTPDDIQEIYSLARRQGLDHSVALRAMMNPNVVDWYFENIGEDEQLTVNTSMQFMLIAKKFGSG